MEVEDVSRVVAKAKSQIEGFGTGYESWGKVEIQQIVVRTNRVEFALANEIVTGQNLCEEDFVVCSNLDHIFGKIFRKKKSIQVILVTRQKYASMIKEEIPPILDDQAQLLGVSVRQFHELEAAPKALHHRFAAIGKEGLCICVGSNFEEAYVAAQLLEKTAKAFVLAKKIGGVKPINKFEAWLMHQFYRFKYSKQARD